jgi:YD repeat-containing protein
VDGRDAIEKAQEIIGKVESDLSKWDVHGPVMMLRTEHAEWDLNLEEWQPARYSTMAAFDLDGTINEVEHHNPDGSASRIRYLYDEAGRLTESQFRMEGGRVSKTVYSYDSASRPVRTVSLDAEGVERETEAYSYDASGRKTKIQFLPPPEPDRAHSYAIEWSELAYGAPGALTMTVSYGATGIPAGILFHDADRKLVRRVVFERDESGRLLGERLESGETSPFPDLGQRLQSVPAEDRARLAHVLEALFGRTISETKYRYDRRGRVLERNTRMGNLGENRDRFLYDDYGNKIEHTTEHESRQIGIDEQGNPHPASEHSSCQHSRFEYRYDTHGNWTERVVWSRLEPNPNFERSNIERRRITYYGA